MLFCDRYFSFLNFNLIMKNKKTLLFLSVLLLISCCFSNLPIGFLYPAAFGIIVIVSAYNLPLFNNFGKFGDFTYGLYIYHFPIIQLFRQYNLFEKYNPIIMAIAVILITLFFAMFSWFLIEKRFLDRFKNSNRKLTPTYAGQN